MNQEIKTEWVNALRNGDFQQQTCGQLKYNSNNQLDSYCCLGVLCELHRIKTNKGIWDGYKYRTNFDKGCMYFLPESVRKWSGLKSNSPLTSLGTLSCLNDTGVSFEEIASIIENEL